MPGDSVVLQAEDASGRPVTNVLWSSSSDAVRMNGSVARGEADGVVTVTAKTLTTPAVSAQATLTVGTIVRGRVHPVDGSSPRSLRFFVRSGDVVDSVDVRPNGGFELRTPRPLSAAGPEVYFDDANRADRQYTPSYVQNYHWSFRDSVTALIVPLRWQIKAGLYAGTTVPVSMNAIYADDLTHALWTNPSGSGMQTFWDAGWFEVREGATQLGWSAASLLAWPETAYPIPVYFSRTMSKGAITAEDSVGFWRGADQVSDAFGRRLFRPADERTLTTLVRDSTITGVRMRPAWAIEVRSDSALSSAGAASTLSGDCGGERRIWRPWPAEEVSVVAGRLASAPPCYPVRPIVAADVSLRSSNFRALGIVGHELVHTLGVHHSCMWPTRMTTTFSAAATAYSRE